MGIVVPNLGQAYAPFKQQGVGILQSGDGTGASHDGRYAYLDTEALLGFVLKLRQPPSERGVVQTYP